MLSTCHQRSGHYASERLHRGRSFFSLALLVIAVGCDVAPTPVQSSQTPSPQETQPLPAPLPAQPSATQFIAKVIGVIDGDTIDVLTDEKQTIRIRFASIDAPERGQPFGNNAKQFVSDAVFGKMIGINETDRDSYGRMVADLYIDGHWLNGALVEAGLAWHYLRFSDDPVLAAAQRDAQTNLRGLWSDPRHVPPWDWRKLSKEQRDTLR